MKHHTTLSILFLGIPYGLVPYAGAAEFSLPGFTAVEGRFFTGSPAFKDQKNEAQLSYVLEPKFRYQSENRMHQLSLTPFLRIDSIDDERTHFDLRDGYWRFTHTNWEFLLGVDKVFWGVAESRHLVDMVNQTDGVEDVDEEDKLGQPMVLLRTQRDWGELQLFLMPYFRERTFADDAGRVRPPLPIDEDDAEYESSAEAWHQDVAIRYSHYIGDWDMGVYYFYGTSRVPLLIPNDRGDELIPLYQLIHQWGADIQYTHEACLWKFEGILREGQGDFFGAMVGGFEYTLFQVAESSADLGLLFEVHLDDRDEDEAPPTTFDNDVFLGSRLALNDTQDTQVLLGSIIDSEDASTFIFAEAERRVGESWVVELEGRFFVNIDNQDPASAFEQDDFIQVSVQRHF